MLKDYFKLAWENISHRKLRSWLTIIGIVIGITSVVALISLSQGVNAVITQEFSKVGTDKIFISPAVSYGNSESGAPSLTEHDFEVIKRVKGIKEVGGLLLKSGEVTYQRNLYFTIVVGMPTDSSQKLVEESDDIEYVAGRGLKAGDKYQAVISHDIANGKVLGRPVSIGEKLLIDGVEFQVVGAIKATGSPGFDTSIIIPQDTAQQIFNPNETIGYREESDIIARLDSSADPDTVANDTIRAMRRDRNEKAGNEDFSVQTATQLIGSFHTILDILNAIVIGIAAISLFVGGVGIMNTMYTSVLQRTSEIGIMKAIGAKNSHILKLFLIESGVIGLIGGTIGTLFGMLLSMFIAYIGRTFLNTILLTSYFPWYLILGALAFAFIVGSLAGIMPAIQASKMSPVEALRYE